MLDGLRLYGRYIDISFRSQMQYRASFVMLSVGHGLMTGLEFLGIWVLFDRFAALDTWSLPEVAFFYGLINIAFALCDAFSRGFDQFASTVKSGDFDRLLLRPRSTALQLAGQELTLKRIGRLTQRFGRPAVGLTCPRLGLDAGQAAPRLAHRPRRRLPVLRPHSAAGDAGFLDYRELGNLQYRNLRRRGDRPVPTGDLPRVVPPLFYLRHPPRLRQLLPGLGDSGAPRPFRFRPVIPMVSPDRGSALFCHLSARLASGRAALPLYWELTSAAEQFGPDDRFGFVICRDISFTLIRSGRHVPFFFGMPRRQ